MRDKDLVVQLLELAEELTLRGKRGDAATCAEAAARILAIPRLADRVQHPSHNSDLLDFSAELHKLAYGTGSGTKLHALSTDTEGETND